MAKKIRRKDARKAFGVLEATILDAGKMDAYVQLRLPRRKAPVEVMLSVSDQMVYLNVHGKPTKALKLPINLRGKRDTAIALMKDLAGQLARGKVDLESGVARGTDCSADNDGLARLVLAAWCEALGKDVPSDDELQRIQEQRRQEEAQLFAQLVEDLRGRAPARESDTFTAKDAAEWREWRDHVQAVLRGTLRTSLASGLVGRPSLADAELIGANLTGLSFGRFDMSRCKLRGADMRGDYGCVDFTAADLRKVRLKGATLAHATFTDADLSESRLDGANLLGAQFLRASLKKANLSGANCDRAAFEDVIWDEAVFDEKTRWPVGFQIPPNLIWAGEGEDPRASQPKKLRKRRTPERLTADMLLSNEQLGPLIVGMEDDPKLSDYVDIDFTDDSILGRELQFSVLLEFLPHRLQDLNLSQKEIDFNTWYRCERFARFQDAIQGGYSDGDHDRADRLIELACSDMDQAEFMELYERIDDEVRELAV